MPKLEVIFPIGAWGASRYDTALDTMLRKIAEAAKEEEGEWAEKYGTNYENEVFLMHVFCWCDKDECPWCKICENWTENCKECTECEQNPKMPNFWYKPSNLKVWWYKYIGRSVETNRIPTVQELVEIEKHCLESLQKKGR